MKSKAHSNRFARVVLFDLPLVVVIVVWATMCALTPVHGYEIETHRAISEEALRVSSVDRRLREDLSVGEGIVSRLRDIERIDSVLITIEKTITERVQEGSAREDDFTALPFGRFENHFHHPLRPLDEAGLSDVSSGVSSTIWAQTRNQLAGDTGSWSWQETRDRFHRALTSQRKKDRDMFLAQTFRGVGHQIHLIQDAASVPHARNESHVAGFSLEKWTQRRFQRTRPAEFAQVLGQTPRILLAPELLTEPTDPLAPIPISKFIDADRYTGQNPDATTSLRDGIGTDGRPVKMAPIGLAEYTNANFVHRDTIFTDTLPQTHKWWSPYPRRSSTNLTTLALPEVVTAEDGQVDQTLYIKKERDGERIKHFLKTSYAATIADELGLTNFSLQLQLDDKVYEDYARLLLPRAVAYSIGLLNYFFRGTLDFTVSGTALTITNTSKEAMEGTFALYADNFSDVRNPVKSFDLTLEPNASSVLFAFTPPAEVAAYVLVFRGRLGSEDGAVAGRVKTTPLNAFFVWQVRFLNDQFDLMVLGSGSTGACFQFLRSLTASGKHTGLRRDYLFFAFVNDPNATASPLDVSALQLTARISPSPPHIPQAADYSLVGNDVIAIIRPAGEARCEPTNQSFPYAPIVLTVELAPKSLPSSSPPIPSPHLITMSSRTALVCSETLAPLHLSLSSKRTT
ncbi:MAG: hypothetical protein ACE5JS_20960 [Nitrospinota bacterium]